MDAILEFKLQLEKIDSDEVYENLNQKNNFQHHQIIDILTPNSSYATAVAIGSQLSKEDNDIEYIYIEPYIYEYYKDIIQKYNDRCIIIVDLSNFPIISTKLNIEDHQPGDYEFTNEVAHYYKNYDMEKEIPFIFVNVNINHTGLVIHKFNL